MYRYPSESSGDSTQLLYLRARHYTRYLNQFIQPDTIVPDPRIPADWNKYLYRLNNPSRYTDPTGHMVACDNDDWACQTHWDYPITYDDEEYTIPLTEEQAEVVDFLLDASEFVTSAAFEPLDWIMTIGYCTEGGCSPWMLEGLFPFIPSSAGRHLDDVPWKSIVDSEYWKLVKRAFKGEPQVIELTEDLKVFRHYGGDSLPTGSPWFSSKPYARPGNARRYLALPDSNLATNVAEFIIPKGTKILVGNAADKTLDTILFSPHAVGGGLQIYLPNPAVARLIK